jgi:hypothetical protein
MSDLRDRALHQIEMTSRCNLACKYCVHKKMPRAKQDMDHATYVKSLEVAARFVKEGTQSELNLAGIGESTMHPRFVDYVNMAREAVGDDCFLVLSTNGVGVTRKMVQGIAPSRIAVWVSPHRPEKAADAIRWFNEYGLLRGLSEGAWTASVDWAGQLDWPVTADTKNAPCPWIPNGRATVFSDGRVSRCCFDSDGCGVMGTIDDLLDGMPLLTGAYKLCGSCHHSVNNGVSIGGTVVPIHRRA